LFDLSRQSEFAILSFDRPDVLNALNVNMLREMDRLLDEVAASDARCLIVKGTGTKAFCAGADIAEIKGRSVEEAYDRTLLGQRVCTKLEELRQFSIALVHGYALGGGCEVALACTFRLATPAARFGLPEVKLGLVPGYGGTQRLSRLIGLSRALEIMLSGRQVDAGEALQLGLVNRVIQEEDSLGEALAYGRQFTSGSRLAQRLIRASARAAMGPALDEGLKIEAYLSALSFGSHDGQEGLTAFVERRPPHFLDR
jgi:enoyl-CoA hydratase